MGSREHGMIATSADEVGQVFDLIPHAPRTRAQPDQVKDLTYLRNKSRRFRV
jgi:hypothetical protein